MKNYFVSCDFYKDDNSFAFPLHFIVRASCLRSARKKAKIDIELLNFVCPFDRVYFKVVDIYEIL